ncbi:hypothetical protein ACCI51_08900 [Microbulbifer echini]|uniref:Uncharacterized protein n=1 Tax=Microbulbifer echini TaxID=1529067 RepID=A0ABV4NMT8_9GAMM|nr:hypothetical protein [uncultured Microbulbifer sp.]
MTKLTLIFSIMLSVFALAACDINEGPAEELGESVDQTADKIGNSVEDACEEVKEGVQAKDTNC